MKIKTDGLKNKIIKKENAKNKKQSNEIKP